MKLRFCLSIVFVLVVSIAVKAEEKYNHFPSLTAPDLITALCNVQDYNKKLKAIANKETLVATDLVKIHELTYTLENAIARLQEDLVVIAANLEEVHKASERLDSVAIATFSQKYLSQSTLLTGQVMCE
jgi:hypothetical protein